ncbi:hypothetical protein D9M72_631780 [compost metagenome]
MRALEVLQLFLRVAQLLLAIGDLAGTALLLCLAQVALTFRDLALLVADAPRVLGRQFGIGAVAVHFGQRCFEAAHALLLAFRFRHLDVAADGFALGVAGAWARGLGGSAEGGERGRGGQHEKA